MCFKQEVGILNSISKFAVIAVLKRSSKVPNMIAEFS